MLSISIIPSVWLVLAFLMKVSSYVWNLTCYNILRTLRITIGDKNCPSPRLKNVKPVNYLLQFKCTLPSPFLILNVHNVRRQKKGLMIFYYYDVLQVKFLLSI